MDRTSIPNFGDLVESKALDGEKKKLEEVLDKVIVVTGFRSAKSKFVHKGTEFYTTIQFYFEDDPDEKPYVLFTGSGVIKEQLESIEAKLEEAGLEKKFRTTIKKVGNYHALT